MTPEQVRERKAALDHIGRELKRQQDHLAVEYQHLRLDCAHPAVRICSFPIGDDGTYCPDCGKAT